MILPLEMKKRIIGAILAIPGIEDDDMRRQLLANLPKDLIAYFPRGASPMLDIRAIVNYATSHGYTALDQILDNGIELAPGSEASSQLAALKEQLAETGPLRIQLPGGGMPPPPVTPLLDHRDRSRIKKRLLDSTQPVRIAIEGKAGLGKGELAASLAWDANIQASYTDGVIWVGLGKRPDMLSALAQIAAQFGVDVSNYLKLKDRAAAVSRVLLGRNCLLFIASVWHKREAVIFRNLSVRAAVVITRSHDVARAFAGAGQNIFELKELTKSEAIKFLTDLVPGAEGLPELEVIAEHTSLPLILRMTAPLLDDALRDGQGLEQLSADVKDPSWRARAIFAGVESSLAHISNSDRNAFIKLAVFGAEPADFDLGAASAIWEVGTTTSSQRMRRLVNANLVVRSPTVQRFMLQQSLADVAQSLFEKKPTAEQQKLRLCHAQYYLSLMQVNRQDNLLFTRELPQLRRAWQYATTTADKRLIFDMVVTLYDYLRRQGLWKDAVDWTDEGLKAATDLGELAQQAVFLSNLGTLYAGLGDRKKSLDYLNRALVIQAEVHDQVGRAQTLNTIGEVYALMRKYKDALSYYDAALSIPEVSTKIDWQARMLANKAWCYLAMRRHKETWRLLKQALGMAAESDSPDSLATKAYVLHTLGWAYRDQAKWLDAREILNISLDMRRQIGDRSEIGQTLHLLGRVLSDIDFQDEALQCLEEALEIFHDVEYYRREAQVLSWIGIINLSKGNWSAAETSLAQALPLIKETRHAKLRFLDRICLFLTRHHHHFPSNHMIQLGMAGLNIYYWINVQRQKLPLWGVNIPDISEIKKLAKL